MRTAPEESPGGRGIGGGGLDRRTLLRVADHHADDERADAEREEGEEHRGDGVRDTFHRGRGGGHIGIVGGMGGDAEQEAGDEGAVLQQVGLVHVLVFPSERVAPVGGKVICSHVRTFDYPRDARSRGRSVEL